MAQARDRRPGSTTAQSEKTEPAPAPPTCAFALCPICTMLTALGEARPDLVEHVLVASREMLLAVRALIDARLEAAPEGPPRGQVERLTIT